ncbi:MAG: TetR/AcrR family transcriptional regulator [Acidimicrobiales bacterium]
MALPRAGTPAEGRELRARGQRTVRKLLDAAAKVLAKRSYHALRVDDVVRTAKTSHGTFYLYFANKEDLLRALLADVADDMAAQAERLGPLTPDQEGRESLRAWLVEFGQLYARHAPAIRAWVEAEIETHEFGRLGADVLGGFAGVLTERITASPHIAADPGRAAVVVVAMIERCNYYATIGQIRADNDQLADALAAVIHASLFGAPT